MAFSFRIQVVWWSRFLRGGFLSGSVFLFHRGAIHRPCPRFVEQLVDSNWVFWLNIEDCG